MESAGFDLADANLADAVVAAVVALSAFFAFYRGFVREALALAGWIGAAVVAWRYHGAAEPYLQPYMSGPMSTAAALGGLFLVSLVVFSVAVVLLSRAVRGTSLSMLDRSLGFLFGAARGAVVVALLFLLGKHAWWGEDSEAMPEWLSGAASRTLIEYAAEALEEFVPGDIAPPPLPPDPADLVPPVEPGDVEDALPSGELAPMLDADPAPGGADSP